MTKTVYSSKIQNTENKTIAGFHIKHITSPTLFSTKYFDVEYDNNGKLCIIKDDMKAVKLSGFNYHPNAQGRTSIFESKIDEVGINEKTLINSFTNKSGDWTKILVSAKNKCRDDIKTSIKNLS